LIKKKTIINIFLGDQKVVGSLLMLYRTEQQKSNTNPTTQYCHIMIQFH